MILGNGGFGLRRDGLNLGLGLGGDGLGRGGCVPLLFEVINFETTLLEPLSDGQKRRRVAARKTERGARRSHETTITNIYKEQ